MKKKNRPASVSSAVASTPTSLILVLPFACSVLIWAVFVTLKFDERFPSTWNGLFQFIDSLGIQRWADFFAAQIEHLKSFFIVVCADAAAAGWASRLIPSSEKSSISALERFIFSLGLGLGILSLLLFLVGVLGWYTKPALWTFYTVFCIGGGVVGLPLFKEMGNALRSFSWNRLVSSPLNWFAMLLIVIAAVMAFVPELFYDSLVYHVGLPQMYVNEGRFVDTPNVYFSRFPMFMHMLYVLGVGLDGSSAAKLFNTTLMLVALGGIVALCRRLQWQQAAVWACLLILAMPVFQLNVWSTAVDAAMGTYTVLAFLAFLIWKTGERHQWPWFVIFSVLTGYVFAIKYTGVVIILSFGPLIAFTRFKDERWFAVVPRLIVFGFAIAVVMSPWLIRNTLFTGNPTYPILAKHFPSRHINMSKIEPEEELVKRYVPHTLAENLTFPWTQTMREISNFNFVGPMTLAMLPLVLVIPFRKIRSEPSLTILTIVYFLIALRFSGDIRYLLPGFFLLAIFIGGGIATLAETRKVLGWVVQAGFSLLVLYQISWIIECGQNLYKPGPVLTGQQSHLDYVSTMHDGLNLCPWNTMTNDLKALPDTSRIYILGTEQVFGFPKRFWYSSCHDDTPLVLWANASATAEELFKKLNDEKFTHILIDAPEAYRLRGYSPFEWTDHGRAVFLEFANKYLHLVDIKPIAQFPQALFLYHIEPDAPPSSTSFHDFFKDVLNL